MEEYKCTPPLPGLLSSSKQVAAWKFSSTFTSLYLIASLSFVVMRKLLLKPGCLRSWQAEATMRERVSMSEREGRDINVITNIRLLLQGEWEIKRSILESELC